MGAVFCRALGSSVTSQFGVAGSQLPLQRLPKIVNDTVFLVS